MGTDWAWSLPLILLNVIIHVFGLAFIFDAFIFFLREIKVRRRFMIRFAEFMSVAALLIVILHAWRRSHGPRLPFTWRAS